MRVTIAEQPSVGRDTATLEGKPPHKNYLEGRNESQEAA